MKSKFIYFRVFFFNIKDHLTKLQFGNPSDEYVVIINIYKKKNIYFYFI